MMRSSTSSSDRPAQTAASAWRRFATVLAGTAIGAVVSVWLFVVLVDPFGRLPLSLPFDRGPVDSNARYAFPMLARDQRFDSAMLGTSTTRLLRPVSLDALLGGRFVNLSMNSATVYEQSRLLEVFQGAHPAPRDILFGIDVQWCQVTRHAQHLTDRPFPEWLYSGSPWVGYREMADFYSVEKAGQAFAEWTGLKRRVYGRDGYTRFVPDDSRYDPVRVAELMHAAAPYTPSEPPSGPPESWKMADMDIGRAAIATIAPRTRVLLVIMPGNRRMIPEPGTVAASALAECKRRIASIASARANTLALDFMRPSPITDDDANYWDPFHYRVGIAERIVADIAASLRGETSGDNQVLARNPADPKALASQ